MGANDKVAAAYHGGEYTPGTEEVEDSYTMDQVQISLRKSTVVAREEFRRWLETVRAEAKAEALNEVADEWERLMKIGKQMFAETTREDNAAFDDWAGQEKPGWLRARANQYKENLS